MRPTGRLLIFVAVLGAALAAGVSPASAHTGDQSYVYLEIFEDHIEGRVELPIDQLNDSLDLSVPKRRAAALAEIEANDRLIIDYLSDHLAIGDGLTTWPIEFDGIDFLSASRDNYAIFEFEVLERFDSVPRQFTVSYDAVIEANADADALLLIASDWSGGVLANEADHLLRYTADRTTQVVDLDEASWWKGMRAVIGLGIDHIEIGTDHILFILALVLPSVLVFRRGEGWEPAAGFGSGLWRVIKIMTMFTVAHSITLTLGGLGIVELPVKPVEFLIALSIALAALHNLRPIFSNKEWLLALGFGLFHGLGFAGLLTDLGLDRTNRFQSLLGFNVGIEIGQAVIILLVFPVLFVLRRTRIYMPLLTLASLGLAAVASAWAVERLFEKNLRVNRIVDPLVEWPRSFWVMLVAGVLAAAYWWREARQRQLRPLPAVDGGDDEPALVRSTP